MAIKHTPRVAEITEQEAYALRNAVMKRIPNFKPATGTEGIQIYNWLNTRSVTLHLCYNGGLNTTSVLLSFRFVTGQVAIEQHYLRGSNSPATHFGTHPIVLREGEPLEGVLRSRKLVTAIKDAAFKAETEFKQHAKGFADFYKDKGDLWN